MEKLIIGINCPRLMDGEYTSDGNVAVVKDDKVVMAIAEERISRKKYDGDFRQGLKFVLDRLNMKPDSIEAIAVCSFGKPTEDYSESEFFITDTIRAELQNKMPLNCVFQQ